MKAMIFAAGLGTRLKPFTDNKPKALALVNQKTLLQHTIEYLKKFNFESIVINVHHFASQIEEYLLLNNNFGCEIHISDEREKLLDTGGGFLNAKKYFNDTEDILIINVDILTNLTIEKFINYHIQNKPLATLAVTKRTSTRYLGFDKNMYLGYWENNSKNEKIIINNECTNLFAFSGIQIINYKIFNLIKQNGVFSIIEMYLSLAADNKIIAYDHTGDILIDVGKPSAIEIAEKHFF